jgi:phospholipase A-2-activating protein
VVGYCSYAFPEPEKKRIFFSALFEAAEWTKRWAVPVPKSRETNGLLMLRGLANAFQEDTSIGDSLWAKDVRIAFELRVRVSCHAELFFCVLDS